MADVPIYCNNCGGQKSGGYTPGRNCKCELGFDPNLAISKQKGYEVHGRYERQSHRQSDLSLMDLMSAYTPKPKPKKDRPKLFGNKARIS